MINNLRFERVAVLYQVTTPPVIDGICKPMKAGGYRDSGADIAYTLRESNISITTPNDDPDPLNDKDWVFADTSEGIQQALSLGATVLWANTVLFRGHALEEYLSKAVRVVGQLPERVHEFDDKWKTNSLLRAAGYPVAHSLLVGEQEMDGATVLEALTEKSLVDHGISFPAIIKPVRGRGSQGVTKINSLTKLKETAKNLLLEKVTFDGTTYSKYGNSLILEEYLPGAEVTITVMPPGQYEIGGVMRKLEHHWALPPVERINHVAGITPYNGVVAVVQNSIALDEMTEPLEAVSQYCAVGARLVGAIAPIRIDCRARDDGEFIMFDLNMKPNLTGAGRPGRNDQDSLSCIAARVIGWSYGDLLVNMLRQAWQCDTLQGNRAQKLNSDKKLTYSAPIGFSG